MTIGLTRTDLSSEHNVRDCRAELDRILDMDNGIQQMGAFAMWGQKWAEAAVDALENPNLDDEDLRKAEKEASDFEEKSGHLQVAIDEAIVKIEGICGALGKQSASAALFSVIENLEKATNL